MCTSKIALSLPVRANIAEFLIVEIEEKGVRRLAIPFPASLGSGRVAPMELPVCHNLSFKFSYMYV